jgi:hypothetical protein
VKKNLLMKKLLSIAFLAIVVMAFASCKKTYVETRNEVYNVTIPASSWVLSTDGKSYTTDVEADAIDRMFNNSGATLVYFSFFNGVYEQIPEVYNGNSFSYIHYEGGITFTAQAAAGGTTPPVKPIEDIRVKLVLIPAQ